MGSSCVYIGLSNPKSPANVGAVMRAAGCFRADGVFYTGGRYDRAARFNTDTKDVNTRIPMHGVDSLLNADVGGAKLVCVEFAEGASPLPAFQHPEKAYYVFGPEDGTLSQALIDRADAVVYVPTIGSMNLAAVVNVVLYDRMAKSPLTISGDELVRQSRDTNNTVRIKSCETPTVGEGD